MSKRSCEGFSLGANAGRAHGPGRGPGLLPQLGVATGTSGLHQHSIWFSRILRVLVKDAQFHSDP